MSEKKPFFEIQIKQDVPTYKAISAVMTDALRVTFDTIATEKNGTEWIDDLEKKLIFAAKNFDTSGMSIDEESESFGIAIQILEGLIGAVRANIVSKE